MSSQHPETTVTQLQQPVALQGLRLEDDGFDGRYDIKKLLGEGGMSEVYGCHDNRLGRDVAMKVLDAAQTRDVENLTRFLREARVQGQLEHPSVVPVYDLGRSPYQATFFTMRRVRGTTLLQILRDVRQKGPNADPRHSRPKLLAAFSRLCLAVDYAHSRGVLHCDIKPSNVMLGEYGEVYLLDWGLARVTGETPLPSEVPTEGTILGTPGYMAPEQIREPARSVQADIYALGAILFEILTLQPLHPRSTAKEAISSTLRGPDARRAKIAREALVPPELEQICAKATRTDPTDRDRSARELAEAVESFLEGDRDAELRREIADDHARAATDAVAKALADPSPAGLEERRLAIREAGRALALDPGQEGALAALHALLGAPMPDLPADARREQQTESLGINRTAATGGALAYLCLLIFVPVTVTMGVRDWFQAMGVIALILLAAFTVFIAGRMGGRSLLGTYLALSVSTAAIGGLSLIASPFLVLPALAGINTMGYAMQVTRRHRLLVAAIGCLAIVVPTALELVGALPRSFAFEDGNVLLLPRMHTFPPGPTTALFLLSSIAMVIAASLYGGRMRDAQHRVERRLRMYAWHLRQLFGGTDQGTDTQASSSDG